MRDAFDRRRRTIVRMLNEIDGIVCVEPEGAFYAFPSVKGLLGRSLRGGRPATSAELAEICINEAKVAVVPGEAFGAPGYFRMSYALGDDDLVEGVSRLAPVRRGETDLGPVGPVEPRGGQEPPVARVLVTEKIAQSGLELLAEAGHEVDVREGLSPDELLGADRRSARAHHPLGHQGHGRGARGRHDAAGGRAGRRRARQRRRHGRHRARRHGRQRADVEHPLGGRAGHGAAAGPGPQHPPGPLRPGGGTLGALEVGGRRAARQDARRRRAGADRRARGPARPCLRDGAHRLRPLRVPGAGAGDGRAPRRHRGAGGAGGLRLHPHAEDARDGRPVRARPVGQGQARHPHRQHRPRRHRRRGGAGRRHPRRHRGGRRPRRVRHRAVHRVAALRAARGRGLPASRRVAPRRRRTRPG